MKRFFKFVLVLSLLAFLPLPAFALTGCPVTSNTISGLLCNIQQFINSLIPILLALGVVYFVWGVVKFMIADTEEAKTKGKDTIIYGIIGFAVIIGLWGLVNIVVNSLGFSNSQLQAPSLAPITSTEGKGTCEMGKNFQGLIQFVTCVLNNAVIPLIFAIAVVMFIWGAVKFFIINADEEAKRQQGKQFMIWGIIALTIMTTVWGLVGLLGSSFNVGGKVLPQVCPPNDPKCK